MNDVENKLVASRTRLILDKPFLGALVLRLPLIEAQGSWCTTSATDARSIYYSAAYMEPLSLSQVQFVLAHEALHCGLSHFARRAHRDLNRWNLACDYAVNQLLLEDGLELPPGALHDEVYKGLSAEEIYPLIERNSNEKTMDQHLYDDQGEGDSQAQQPDDSEQKHSDKQNNDQENTQQSNSKTERESNDSSQTKPNSESRNPSGSKAQQPLSDPSEKRHAPNATADATAKKEVNDRTKDQSEHKPNNQSGEQSENPNRHSGNERIDPQGKELDDTPMPEHGRPADQSQSHQANSDEHPTEQQTNREAIGSQSSVSRPPPLSAQEREKLSTQWQQRLVSAAQHASAAGKMKGSVARLVDRLLRSSVPWRTLLARFLSGASRTDYSFTRPSQRRGGDAILPSLHSQQINVLIALDTSGSIEQDELTEFVTEVNAIKSLVNARITLLACDSSLDDDGPWVFEPWEKMVLPNSFNGSGGTDFTPVFDWANDSELLLDLIIYFTDALGRFPQQVPATETLWLIKGSAEVPWGQRIQLN